MAQEALEEAAKKLGAEMKVEINGAAASASSAPEETAGNSFGHQIYKHLMNGVSTMFPFVVAGGVLTAISFLWGIYSADPTNEQYNVIAATIAKKKFTRDDRSAAYVNYSLGCTHITEGAIPFAAKDSVRVSSILRIGSSISAILSYVTKITVPTPHGGFLILKLVNHSFLWVGCILAGSIVGDVLYVVTCKNIEE